MKRNTFLKSLLGLSVASMFPFNWLTASSIKKNRVIKFTPENISENNVGLYIIEDRADVEKYIGVGTTCVWKLVYQHKYNTVTKLLNNEAKVELPKYGMCNVLTDGWTHWIGDKQQLCDHLNEDGKYRILTKEELIHIINNRTNIKQLVRTL